MVKAGPQSLLSSCRFTWGEEEAVGEVVVLAVGSAALTVIGRHSGVHSDTLSANRNLRDRSRVLLRGAKQDTDKWTLFSDVCHRVFQYSCVRGRQVQFNKSVKVKRGEHNVSGAVLTHGCLCLFFTGVCVCV